MSGAPRHFADLTMTSAAIAAAGSTGAAVVNALLFLSRSTGYCSSASAEIGEFAGCTARCVDNVLGRLQAAGVVVRRTLRDRTRSKRGRRAGGCLTRFVFLADLAEDGPSPILERAAILADETAEIVSPHVRGTVRVADLAPTGAEIERTVVELPAALRRMRETYSTGGPTERRSVGPTERRSVLSPNLIPEGEKARPADAGSPLVAPLSGRGPEPAAGGPMPVIEAATAEADPPKCATIAQDGPKGSGDPTIGATRDRAPGDDRRGKSRRTSRTTTATPAKKTPTGAAAIVAAWCDEWAAATGAAWSRRKADGGHAKTLWGFVADAELWRRAFRIALSSGFVRGANDPMPAFVKQRNHFADVARKRIADDAARRKSDEAQVAQMAADARAFAEAETPEELARKAAAIAAHAADRAADRRARLAAQLAGAGA